MINHGRTLLLNKDGAERPAPTFFLEEFVEPDFRIVALNTALRSVYQSIIGETADDAFANFRVWQYMRILHSTEFESLLTDLDSRITYLNDRTLVDREVIRSVEPSSAEALGIIGSVIGEPESSQACPRLLFNWEVSTATPNSVHIVDAGTRVEKTEEVTFADGISSLISMPGQLDVSIRLQTSVLPIGAVWSVTVQGKPPEDLAEVLGSLEALSEETFLRLFGTENVEPYKTLRELWDKHHYFHYRMSAVLLAHIYRIEELRASGR